MSKNDITGDRLISRTNSKQFEENFDKIFNSKCPKCEGSGRHFVSVCEPPFYEPCDLCNGTGKATVI